MDRPAADAGASRGTTTPRSSSGRPAARSTSPLPAQPYPAAGVIPEPRTRQRGSRAASPAIADCYARAYYSRHRPPAAPPPAARLRSVPVHGPPRPAPALCPTNPVLPAMTADPSLSELQELQSLSEVQKHELNQSAALESTAGQAMLAGPISLSDLAQEYKSNPDQSFAHKLAWIAHPSRYSAYYKTRGDGDCFLCVLPAASCCASLLTDAPHALLRSPPASRSFGFALLLRILEAQDRPLHHFAVQHIQGTQTLLDQAGFERDVYLDFYEPIGDLLKRIFATDPAITELTPSSLVEAFNDPVVSNSVVVYLRLVTAAFLKLHQEEYAPFLFAYEGSAGTGEAPTMDEFVRSQIEALGVEADHLAVTALSRALLVTLDVVYLVPSAEDHAVAAAAAHDPQTATVDTRTEVAPEVVRFDLPGATGETSVSASAGVPGLLDMGALLFRPGHYDVLVPAPKTEFTPTPYIPPAP